MTSTLSSRLVITLVLASLWLSGCAHSPRSKDMALKPDLIEMKNKEQMDKLSYLGRFILSAEDRGKLTKRITDSYSPGFANTAGPEVGVGMVAAQMVNGSMISPQGFNTAATVGVAFRTINLFLPDGSLDTASGLFLPEQWNGRALVSKEDAQQAAWEYVDQRVKSSAAAVGRTAICTLHCEDDVYRVYLLTLSDNLQGSYKFRYNPKYIVMDFWIGKDGMQPYKPDNTEIWALGFTPKWYAGDGRLAVPRFREVSLDEQNRPRHEKNGDYSTENPYVNAVPLGRELLRHFYDDGVGYGFYVIDRMITGRFMSYRGKTYSFNSPSNSHFIRFEATEKPAPD